MLQLLITLTLVEVVLVLVVLLVYLLLVAGSLERTAKLLAKVSFGVRAIETQSNAIAPAVTRINTTLEAIYGALPGLTKRMDRLGTGGTR